jgi:acetyl/propionyl-CoA carboxylase alpha subunit
MKFFAHSNGHDFELEIHPDRDRLRVRVGTKNLIVTFDDRKSTLRTAFIGDRRIDFGWDCRDGTTTILIDGIGYDVALKDSRTGLLEKVIAEAPTAAVEVRAPIPGLITKVLLKAGAPVRKDQPVLCLDAMKLENEIASPRDGVLKAVKVQPGQAVEKGRTLFVLE